MRPDRLILFRFAQTLLYYTVWLYLFFFLSGCCWSFVLYDADYFDQLPPSSPPLYFSRERYVLSFHIFLLPRVCSLCTWRRGAVYCFSPARNYWNLFWEPRKRSTTRLRTVRVIFVLSFFISLFIRNFLRPIFAIKRRGRRQLKTIKTTEIQDV